MILKKYCPNCKTIVCCTDTAGNYPYVCEYCHNKLVKKDELNRRIIQRVDKENYYLDIAQVVLERGTCIRRNYGAVIVKNDQVISTGYSGSPRGQENCCDKGVCKRQELNVPPGERYELCCSVHAEQNAIISASREQMIGATLYLTGIEMGTGKYVKNAMPCDLCKRFIKNSGIAKVIIRDTRTEFREYNVEGL